MQKYYAIDLSEQDGPMRAPVYRASDVDNYRDTSCDIIGANGRELTRMAARITELEQALKQREDQLRAVLDLQRTDH
jgi:hypothetical protein